MEKPDKRAYITLSDGNLESFWTADSVAMVPLARRAATYARMTLAGITQRQWDSAHQPPKRTAFLLIGTGESEEIWEGISKEQAAVLFRWVRRELDKLGHAKGQPLKASGVQNHSLALVDRSQSIQP